MPADEGVRCEIPQKETRTDRALKFLISLAPFLSWRHLVNKRALRADLGAGLTGAVIVVPQGVAFATIAGLPPEYGLYAAMVPTIVAALFGSSMHLISGPTTAISLVIFANVSLLADPMSPEYVRLVLTLTFLTGVFQLALGLARLGALVNFVSHSVVTGFTAGAALLIMLSQLGNFLGVNLPKGMAFHVTIGEIVRRLPETNPFVLTVALTTFIAAIVVKSLRPRWPAMFMAMVLGAVLAAILGGEERGMRLVGALPDSLPPLSLPDFSLDKMRTLVPGALAVAMLGLAEAVSVARAVATRSQQRIDNNQEFVGQGLANLVAGFFSAYASSGSFTRTGVNYDSGAVTPLAAIFSALFLAAIVLLIAPLTAYLPIASMAAVILLAAWNLIDFKTLYHIVRTDRAEIATLAATFLATLFLELEFAIYAGVMLSLLLYLKRTSHPHFITLAPDPDNKRRSFTDVTVKKLKECPQLKVLRLDGSIFFGAVNHVAQALHDITAAYPEQCHILIVGSGINFIDAAGCHMIFHENHSLKLSGREMYLCSLKPEALAVLRRGGCFMNIGPDRIFATKEEAIEGILPRLDPERCACCPNRVFLECARLPGGEFFGRPEKSGRIPAGA